MEQNRVLERYEGYQMRVTIVIDCKNNVNIYAPNHTSFISVIN